MQPTRPSRIPVAVADKGTVLGRVHSIFFWWLLTWRQWPQGSSSLAASLLKTYSARYNSGNPRSEKTHCEDS